MRCCASKRLEIEERLRFEGLISDLSARFINLAPDQIDGEINRGLQTITEFFRCGPVHYRTIFRGWNPACVCL